MAIIINVPYVLPRVISIYFVEDDQDHSHYPHCYLIPRLIRLAMSPTKRRLLDKAELVAVGVDPTFPMGIALLWILNINYHQVTLRNSQLATRLPDCQVSR